MKIAVVAGTFDRLHIAHLMMLWTAFKLGDHIIVGLMKDESLKGKIYRELMYDYKSRCERLKKLLNNWVKTIMKGKTYEIVPIAGPYDVITEVENIDYLVVSEETLPRAIAINAIRRNRGLKEVKLVVIPIIRAADLRPLASHRIRVGEVDHLGNSKLRGDNIGDSK